MAQKLVWQEARYQARQLLHDGQPGDPFEIASRLGLKVVVTDLPPDVSGMIVKEAKRDGVILLSRDDSIARQRFTCAHELGHFIERTAVSGDADFSFRDLRSPDHYDLHEFFADEFAGELLMPEPGFSQAMDRMSKASLALHYQVSIGAVEKRIQRLSKNPYLLG